MSALTRSAAHRRLIELRQTCRGLLASLSNEQAAQQAHPDLSPIAWHVGHCFFTETLWLREHVLEQPCEDADLNALYVPENSAKAGRGQQAPSNDDLLDYCQESERRNRLAWRRAEAGQHELLQEEYLHWFLVQHYGQHLETMQMQMQQLRLEGAKAEAAHSAPLTRAATDLPNFVDLSAGRITVGTSGSPMAYDNELQVHDVELRACGLGAQPISNAHWLAFMQDDGYGCDRHWCDAGRVWLRESGARHPLHWREGRSDEWHSGDALDPLHAEAPVHGICWFEASAFARWANARLPHEHELEHAFRTQQVERHGEVWEWCTNALAPYPDFRAFPYKGYSEAWFDGHHRVLRGGSRHTQPELRRPGFRNFYPETHRHVFAGLRLARDA